MSFKNKYTRNDLVTAEANILASMKPEDLEKIDKDFIAEKDKIILSNDAFMLGESLEALVNVVINRCQ